MHFKSEFLSGGKNAPNCAALASNNKKLLILKMSRLDENLIILMRLPIQYIFLVIMTN